MDRTKLITYGIIGALVIALCFSLSSNIEETPNQKVIDAKNTINRLEAQSQLQAKVIKQQEAKIAHILDSVRVKTAKDDTFIKNKYASKKGDIIFLSDDESIDLLRKNLGAE